MWESLTIAVVREESGGNSISAHREFDALVIGSGMGGLAFASIMAKLRKWRVLVLEALENAMDLIDEAAALLQAGRVKDASDKLHDARQKVTVVRAGDRHGKLGAP
jgi:choline dehydrogenase-like flavoprotein